MEKDRNAQFDISVFLYAGIMRVIEHNAISIHTSGALITHTASAPRYGY